MLDGNSLGDLFTNFFVISLIIFTAALLKFFQEVSLEIVESFQIYSGIIFYNLIGENFMEILHFLGIYQTVLVRILLACF